MGEKNKDMIEEEGKASRIWWWVGIWAGRHRRTASWQHEEHFRVTNTLYFDCGEVAGLSAFARCRRTLHLTAVNFDWCSLWFYKSGLKNYWKYTKWVFFLYVTQVLLNICPNVVWISVSLDSSESSLWNF